MNAPPRIPCSACQGSGHVPMHHDLMQVFTALRARPATAPELRERMNRQFGSPTSTNNQLEDLRRLGYATRVKEGRRWRYAATSPGAELTAARHIRLEILGCCHSDDDGDCNWAKCPQLRDKEPRRTGRHCPLDKRRDEE